MEEAGGYGLRFIVVPANAGTHNHRRSRQAKDDVPESFKQYPTRRMGPGFRRDDVEFYIGRQMTAQLRAGVITAIAVLALDQASKFWLLRVFDIGHRGAVKVTPFFDLVLAWNTGISYGWFQNESASGQAILLAVKAVAVIILAVWMARSRTLIATVALGLIIGGAIGNAVDRFAYGAVVDFALFHAQIGGNTFNWYVFNLADVAIVAGVAALLYDSFLGVPAAKAP
jgi:signal peptidase II